MMNACSLGVLDQEIIEANAFWERARAYVLEVASDIGVRVEIADHDDEFLFELFEDGRVPERFEVIEALHEMVGV